MIFCEFDFLEEKSIVVNVRQLIIEGSRLDSFFSGSLRLKRVFKRKFYYELVGLGRKSFVCFQFYDGCYRVGRGQWASGGNNSSVNQKRIVMVVVWDLCFFRIEVIFGSFFFYLIFKGLEIKFRLDFFFFLFGIVWFVVGFFF